MIGDDSYEKKKSEEQAWYEPRQPRRDLIQRILHHPLLYSYNRIIFSYIYPKRQMAKAVRRLIPFRVERMLIAPCGTGDDEKYLKNFANHIHGIDLSPIALQKCPANMHILAGDMLRLPYSDESIDFIASSLFFHHYPAKGFPSFLHEFYRILKPGGGIIILEPSIWYPLNLLTRPLKWFNNPYGEVKDEGPFPPGRLLAALKETGFINMDMEAATFSHCSFYMPVAKAVNQLLAPILPVWPIKYFGWLVLFWGMKKGMLQKTPLSEGE